MDSVEARRSLTGANNDNSGGEVDQFSLHSRSRVRSNPQADERRPRVSVTFKREEKRVEERREERDG